jgi:hypothetical protein
MGVRQRGVIASISKDINGNGCGDHDTYGAGFRTPPPTPPTRQMLLLVVLSLVTCSFGAPPVLNCDASNGANSVPGVWCDFEGPCPWKGWNTKGGETGFKKMSAAQVIAQIKKKGEWEFRGPMWDSQNKTDGKFNLNFLFNIFPIQVIIVKENVLFPIKHFLSSASPLDSDVISL